MWKAELMKGSKTDNRPAAAVDTLIGRLTELHGDVHFSGGLHVDGKIKGKIIADDDKSTVLSVSETGQIEGDVRVSHVVLNGTIVGDVYAAQRITLSSKARVSGNVYYKVIEMVSGATVNGQLVYQGDTPMPAALTHHDSAQEPPLRYVEEQVVSRGGS